MVKKETIGKIQLILGIILLLGGIIGSILTYDWYNKQIESSLLYTQNNLDSLEKNENYSSFNEDSKMILRMETTTFWVNWELFISDISMSLGLLFILSIIISFLFITQGLVNMRQINN